MRHKLKKILMLTGLVACVLTGCGNKKIMELNHIQDEVEDEFLEKEDDGPSTIFGDLFVELDEGDALAEENKAEKEDSEDGSTETDNEETEGENDGETD